MPLRQLSRPQLHARMALGARGHGRAKLERASRCHRIIFSRSGTPCARTKGHSGGGPLFPEIRRGENSSAKDPTARSCEHR
eukprot:5229282-Pyramimonas_sp.AAC.1